MSATELLSRWSVAPAALLLAGVLAAVRFGLDRGAGARRALVFAGGLAALVVALCSPIAVLANGYLFTAHMVQHLVLLLIVPPLLLLGTSESAVQRALRRPPVAALERHAGQGPMAWLLGVGIMWLWHTPSLCAASLHDPWLRGVQAVSLVAAGSAFAWPILAPARSCRLATLPAVIYLLLACFGCSLLGVWLTFSPLTVCPGFFALGQDAGLRALVRDTWGLGERADVQLAGLTMWVPTCFGYLTAILYVMARAYAPRSEAQHGV